MDKIIKGLEALANSANSNDAVKVQKAIQEVRDLNPAKELDLELAVWQSKLSVILKEPVGRQGLVKHARFWAEKIKNAK